MLHVTSKNDDIASPGSFADLFCGCGGLALGFKNAGFKSIFAVDIEESACKTYEANFHHSVYCGDISEIEKLQARPEIIIGGPPCQGFSPLGKMSPSEACKQNHLELNKLWQHFFRLVKDSMPRALVIENVPELLRSKEYCLIIKNAESLGYNVTAGMLKAEEFGVPQRRRRGFILGALDFQPRLPSPTRTRTTVRDAIADLPAKPDGANWHIGRNPTPTSLERYECIPPGGNRFDLLKNRPDICPECWKKKKTGSTDVFGRLRWNEPSLTIRTEFYKPEKGRYLHPSENRPITHREAARLQTFPDDFIFKGSRIEVARMIGNAVPPRLSYHIAKVLMKSLRAKGMRQSEF